MTDPQAAAEAVVARIQQQKVPHVTPEDGVVLAACPAPTLVMRQMLIFHYDGTGDLGRATAEAAHVFHAEPSALNAKNFTVLLQRAKRYDEAIAFLNGNEAVFDPIEWNDALAMAYADTGETTLAARHGTRSLELKDAACTAAPELKPVIRPFDREAPLRNVIAFSLWGEDPRYLSGAQTNALVARYIYPGWSCRFYVDDSVPAAAIKGLQQQGAQVVKAPPDWPASQYGLFWRFLVEDDPGIDHYLIRDADSVMNVKERAAVEDWLASGRTFHLMRDLPRHSELILAGMWGAHRGNIGDMAARVDQHVTGARKALGNRITDQVFLRNQIWPIVRQDVLAHDAWFDFGDPVRFREEFALPRRMHIGQNDWVHRRPAGKRRA